MAAVTSVTLGTSLATWWQPQPKPGLGAAMVVQKESKASVTVRAKLMQQTQLLKQQQITLFVKAR